MPWKERYEITGEWSGYRPGQARVVHRVYATDVDFAVKAAELGAIRFIDNTYLWLRVRKLAKGERRKPELRGYDLLIRDCIRHGVDNVDELLAAQKEQR